jgi:hypothetical protein
VPDLSQGLMGDASGDLCRRPADDMSLAYAVPLRAIRQRATTVLQAEWTHGAICWRRTASNAMMNPLSLTGCGLSHSRRGILSERAEAGDIEAVNLSTIQLSPVTSKDILSHPAFLLPCIHARSMRHSGYDLRRDGPGRRGGTRRVGSATAEMEAVR